MKRLHSDTGTQTNVFTHSAVNISNDWAAIHTHTNIRPDVQHYKLCVTAVCDDVRIKHLKVQWCQSEWVVIVFSATRWVFPDWEHVWIGLFPDAQGKLSDSFRRVNSFKLRIRLTDGDYDVRQQPRALARRYDQNGDQWLLCNEIWVRADWDSCSLTCDTSQPAALNSWGLKVRKWLTCNASPVVGRPSWWSEHEPSSQAPLQHTSSLHQSQFLTETSLLSEFQDVSMETMWEETEWLHFLELCCQVMEDWPVREGKCYLSVIVLLAREIDISDYWFW